MIYQAWYQSSEHSIAYLHASNYLPDHLGNCEGLRHEAKNPPISQCLCAERLPYPLEQCRRFAENDKMEYSSSQGANYNSHACDESPIQSRSYYRADSRSIPNQSADFYQYPQRISNLPSNPNVTLRIAQLIAMLMHAQATLLKSLAIYLNNRCNHLTIGIQH
ncbi:hypothetical protein Aperf_G00000120126 [Anoplocephala perfoliata]